MLRHRDMSWLFGKMKATPGHDAKPVLYVSHEPPV